MRRGDKIRKFGFLMMEEDYLLLLLADSNLPTGSFVASSGLESYIKHGFSSSLHFIRDSLSSYASSSLPFVSDTHHVVQRFAAHRTDILDSTLSDIRALDEFYESITLNHVTRRASKTQGVALLTLYSKGFSRPPILHDASAQLPRESRLSTLIDQFKLSVRQDKSHGHLPICWGILTAALGLTLGTQSSTT
jgi:urease accessory protein